MNIKGLILTLLGMQKAAEINDTATSDLEVASRSLRGVRYTFIPDSEIHNIVGMVNKARSNVKVPAYAMPKVHWNYDLQAALKRAVAHTDPDWWFQKNQTKARYNGQVLMDYAPFNTSFPGYDFFIHDGCQSDSRALSRIFQMRALNQAKFFNYNMCSNVVLPSKGYINSYFSCADIPNKNNLVSNKAWSWVWQYYPKIVNDDVEDFACMLLGHQGPNAAGGYRPNHFFCYWGKKSHPQTSEKPYIAAGEDRAPGWGCPGKVMKNLCI